MSDIKTGSLNPRALRPGSELPSYVIDKVLGAGGFGITYLARHKAMSGKLVAIKEYMPKDSAYRNVRSIIELESEAHREQFEDGLDNFFEEAESLYRLRKTEHPSLAHIVKVEDVFRYNHTAYVVMEYVEGDSLETMIRQMIETDQKLSEDRIRNLFGQLGSAAAFLHRQRLLHRDITPSNIILRKDDDQPVLIDFGSAKSQVGYSLPIGAGRTVANAYTRIPFTPGYAPLEQSEGIDQSERTDIYSLAATMYHLTLRVLPVPAQARRGEIDEGRPDPMPTARELGTKMGYSKALLNTIDAGLKLRMIERPETVEHWLTPNGILDAAEHEFPPGSQFVKADPAPGEGASNGTRSAPRAGGKAPWYVGGAVAAGGMLAVAAWFFTQPTQADLFVESRTAITAAPFDTKVVRTARDGFAAAQIEASDAQLVQATAGGLICDQLAKYRQHTGARDIEKAAINLARIDELAQEAEFPAAFMQKLNADFRFESGLRRMTELLNATELDVELASSGNALLDEMRTAGNGLPRFAAATQALAHATAAADQLAQHQYAKARQELTAATNVAGGMGIGTVDFAPALATIDAQRDRYVEDLNERAATTLQTEPTDPQALQQAAADFAETLRVAPGNALASAGAALTRSLQRFAEPSTAGPVDDLANSIAALQPDASAAGIPAASWQPVVAQYRATQQARRLTQAAETLASQPLQDDSLQAVEALADAVIADVPRFDLDASLAERAVETKGIVAALRPIIRLQGRHAYDRSQRRLSALLAANPDDNVVTNAVAAANAVIIDNKAAEVERRWTTALSSLNEWRLPATPKAPGAALNFTLALAPEEPRVLTAQNAITQLQAVASATAERRFTDAFDRLKDATATAEPIELTPAFLQANLEWLRDQATAEADREVAAAFALLRRQPVNADTHQQAQARLARADALVQLTNRGEPDTGPLHQALVPLKQIPAALASGQFVRANELAEQAADAVPAADFDQSGLRTRLADLIVQRKGAFQKTVAAEVAKQVNAIRRTLASAPVDVDNLQQAQTLLDSLTPLRENPEVAHDWSLVSDVETVLGALTQARSIADNNQYTTAETLLVETSVVVQSNTPWRTMLLKGVTHLEEQKTARITRLLDDAGERLFAQPFDATSWAQSEQQYAQVRIIEASDNGLGSLGGQFIDLLKQIAQPVQARNFAWMQTEGRQLSRTAKTYSRLPAGLKTLAAITKEVDSHVNRQMQQAQSSLESVFTNLTYNPEAPNTFRDKLRELEAIRADAAENSLANIVAIADALRPRLERLHQATQLLQARKYDEAKALARRRNYDNTGLFSVQQRERLSAAEQLMRRSSTILATRAQVRNNATLIRAFNALAADRGSESAIAAARPLVDAVLKEQVDFPDGLTADRFLNALESGSDCASRTAALDILRELNYPFNIAWTRDFADGC